MTLLTLGLFARDKEKGGVVGDLRHKQARNTSFSVAQKEIQLNKCTFPRCTVCNSRIWFHKDAFKFNFYCDLMQWMMAECVMIRIWCDWWEQSQNWDVSCCSRHFGLLWSYSFIYQIYEESQTPQVSHAPLGVWSDKQTIQTHRMSRKWIFFYVLNDKTKKISNTFWIQVFPFFSKLRQAAWSVMNSQSVWIQKLFTPLVQLSELNQS